MRRQLLRRRPRRPGVSTIFATLLLIAITIIAGAALWELQFRYSTESMYVTYIATAGLKVPAWGDPTDCTPFGYPESPASSWSLEEWDAYYDYCEDEVGNFSLENATSVTFTSVSPVNIPLSEIDVYFLCHNNTPVDKTTALIGGSLAAMTWFPGSSTSPAPDAPTLGNCGTFNASGYGGGAFGTLYNRLAIFVPIHQGVNVLQAGDTLVLYVHTGGSVYDPQTNSEDQDDFHGAPSWCFTTPGACELRFLYVGQPEQLLAQIPIYSISGAGE